MKKQVKTSHRSGFTLIELLIVVAIIGIVSVLAIQKLSGLKGEAQTEINKANLVRISAAVETYETADAIGAKSINYNSALFDKLDSLTLADYTPGTPGDLTHFDQVQDVMMVYSNQTANIGLASDLITIDSTFGRYMGVTAPLLGPYYLSASDVQVLRNDLGINSVMMGYPITNPGGYSQSGDDGSYVQYNASNPDTCASWLKNCATGMPVAIVNPAACSGRTPVGANIYKAFGSDVSVNGSTYKLQINGTTYANYTDALEALRASDGLLMAFGLGNNSALISKKAGGFDSAPVCPIMKQEEYRRYILLFRVKSTRTINTVRGATVTNTVANAAEFAGVIDSRGNTIQALRNAE